MSDNSDIMLPDARGRNSAGKGSSRRKGDDAAAYRKNGERLGFGEKNMPCGHSKIQYMKLEDRKSVCTKCGWHE